MQRAQNVVMSLISGKYFKSMGKAQNFEKKILFSYLVDICSKGRKLG